jgi:hypothetical protein
VGTTSPGRKSITRHERSNGGLLNVGSEGIGKMATERSARHYGTNTEAHPTPLRPTPNSDAVAQQ